MWVNGGGFDAKNRVSGYSPGRTRTPRQESTSTYRKGTTELRRDRQRVSQKSRVRLRVRQDGIRRAQGVSPGENGFLPIGVPKARHEDRLGSGPEGLYRPKGLRSTGVRKPRVPLTLHPGLHIWRPARSGTLDFCDNLVRKCLSGYKEIGVPEKLPLLPQGGLRNRARSKRAH